MSMIFERDIFISYAHIDNLPLKAGDKGWVETFHRALEVRLAQLMGERPEIWRDQKLQGNDIFGDEIAEQLPKTAVMITILTPRYIKWKRMDYSVLTPSDFLSNAPIRVCQDKLAHLVREGYSRMPINKVSLPR